MYYYRNRTPNNKSSVWDAIIAFTFFPFLLCVSICIAACYNSITYKNEPVTYTYYFHDNPETVILFNDAKYEVLGVGNDKHTLPSTWTTSGTSACLKLEVDDTHYAYNNEYWVGRVGYDPGQNKFWTITSYPTDTEKQLAYYYYLHNN